MAREASLSLKITLTNSTPGISIVPSALARALMPAISVRGVTKTYPGVVALDDVTLEINMGEVHALVGENGAGKSTLMKVVAGAVAQDSGNTQVCGVDIIPGNPRSASTAGLAMIYQELTVVPQMSAAYNVFLGRMPRRAGVVSRADMFNRFHTLAEQIGTQIDPEVAANRLPVPKQRLLEVMRALAEQRRVVVMDEPTASLGHDDREHLQSVVRRLRADGRTVVYISHDLGEVLALADRVTVMREGRIIETAPASGWTKRTLVAAMLGRRLESLGRRQPTGTPREELLQIGSLVAAGGSVRVAELSVAAGEIVGVGGLVGSGRTELLRALAGADATARGSLIVDGRSFQWPRSVPVALSLGLALVPEERQRDGLCLGLPAYVNVLLSGLGSASRHGWLSPGGAARLSADPAQAMGFDTTRLDQPAGTFSGGNQQKLLLARWLHRRPRVLMLDEPTRGIDLGAKEEIFGAMRRLADEGMGVLLVSSDLDEVVNHSDRVAVMARGTIVAVLDSPVEVKDILEMSFEVEPLDELAQRPQTTVGPPR